MTEHVKPAEEARVLPIPDCQRETLHDRLRDMDSNPNDQQDWEEVKAELWPTRAAWLDLSLRGLARAYGNSEPEYSIADVVHQEG